MTVVIIIACALLALCGLYLLSTMGRRKQPDMDKLRGWAYAHRGLHDSSRPENSMSAFRAALAGGYGVELDVHLLRDGTLAVMHDSALKRTTGADGRMEDLTAQQLTDYHLEGTTETIPTFRQVLELFNGNAPMVVELKVADNNYAALTETVCNMLDCYPGTYCLESFDPRCIRWLKKHRPDMPRGQLTQNYFTDGPKLPGLLKFLLTHQMLNFLIRPDFVAYRYADRHTLSNFLVRKIWGVQGVTWTIQNRAEYDTALAEGWLPIFENFTP